MFGFHFTETLSGTFTRDGSSEERAITFTFTARARSWLAHLRDRKAEIEGTVSMDGIVAGTPLRGELTIDPVLGKLIRYDFRFDGDDGRPYHFLGQKDVTLADLVGSMTTLSATVKDAGGRTVATCHLRFDPRDLPRFLASFRPSF